MGNSTSMARKPGIRKIPVFDEEGRYAVRQYTIQLKDPRRFSAAKQGTKKKRTDPFVIFLLLVIFVGFTYLVYRSLRMNETTADNLKKFFGFQNATAFYTPAGVSGRVTHETHHFRAFGFLSNDDPKKPHGTASGVGRTNGSEVPFMKTGSIYSDFSIGNMSTGTINSQVARDHQQGQSAGLMWLCNHFHAPSFMLPPFCRRKQQAVEDPELSSIHPLPQKPSVEILEPIGIRVFRINRSSAGKADAKLWKPDYDENKQNGTGLSTEQHASEHSGLKLNESSLSEVLGISREKRAVSYSQEEDSFQQEPISTIDGYEEVTEKSQDSPLEAISDWLPAPPLFFSQPELQHELENYNNEEQDKADASERSVDIFGSIGDHGTVDAANEQNNVTPEQQTTDELCDGEGQPCRKSVNEAGDAPSLIRPEPAPSTTRRPSELAENTGEQGVQYDPRSYDENTLYMSCVALMSLVFITACYAVLSKIRQRRPADDVEAQLDSAGASGEENQQTKEFQNEPATSKAKNPGPKNHDSEESDTTAPRTPY